MKQDTILKQKIGLRLSHIGMLSKVFAIQSFLKNNFELTPEQFTVLNTLRENNGMYLRQLAYKTCKDRPNITRIASILEEKGYLSSVIDSEKRLVKKLYITDKGIEFCEMALPTILEIWSATSENISEEEINSFLTTLDKIEVNLKNNVIMQN